MATFPIVISSSATLIPINLGVAGSAGVYVKNSTDRYVVTTDVDGDFNPIVNIYKSTDNGQDGTWNPVDMAHAPQWGVKTCACTNGTAIRAVFIDPVGNGLVVTDFDTLTDTWGAPSLPSGDPDNSNPVDYCGQLNDTLYATGKWVDVPGSSPSVEGASWITFSSGSWGSFHTVAAPPFDSDKQSGTVITALIVTATRIHAIVCCAGAVGPTQEDALYQSNLTDGSGDIAVINGTDTFFGEVVGLIPCVGSYNSGTVFMVLNGITPSSNFFKIMYGSSPDGDQLAFSAFSLIDPTSEQGNLEVNLIGCSFIAGQFRVFYGVTDFDPDPATVTLSYAINGSSALIGTAQGSSGTVAPVLSAATGLSFPYAIAFTASSDYWEELSTPTPPAPAFVSKSVGGGGVYFPRVLNKSLLTAQIQRVYGYVLRDFPPLSSFFLFPNDFDLCLSRELALYDTIDRLAMSCARKPECFLQQERDWLDSPPGWRTFNPVKAIPLPAPADGDVTLLSFRVPYGYDGVITAQYHGYTLNFEEGTGDLQWRISADDRYLRDCGDMTLTLGNPKQLSPVYGGLQLRSGNLVKYTVSAPNLTGLLPPPGTGNILAGLHGFFYPRM